MAGSTFGNLFRITTWGESHGAAIGVVVDGCPAGLTLCSEDIQKYLNRRSLDRLSIQHSVRKLTRWKFFRESLKERQQALLFP